MLNVTRLLSSEIQNGKLILQFLGDDNKKYPMSLEHRAASESLVALLQAANDLPHNDQITVEGIGVSWSVELAVGERMQPALLFGLGGLDIAIARTKQELATLRDNISAFLEKPH